MAVSRRCRSVKDKITRRKQNKIVRTEAVHAGRQCRSQARCSPRRYTLYARVCKSRARLTSPQRRTLFYSTRVSCARHSSMSQPSRLVTSYDTRPSDIENSHLGHFRNDRRPPASKSFRHVFVKSPRRVDDRRHGVATRRTGAVGTCSETKTRRPLSAFSERM